MLRIIYARVTVLVKISTVFVCLCSSPENNRTPSRILVLETIAENYVLNINMAELCTV